jgi:hypothetical protein
LSYYMIADKKKSKKRINFHGISRLILTSKAKNVFRINHIYSL